ncbi:HVO_0234 family beta-propeller protein [Halohasta salina]|uniref:HVO_0234 family beta-propeller protein n=1 Tax=Halohasta salina TaxID=2961621 RepID=UPI0020A31ADF|nr:hypothetical protein [Halohasta salina]
MQTLTEKRVFGDKSGTTELFVASETGLVGVSVSADQIGEFGLAHRGPVETVAASDRGVMIGTAEGVLHSDPTDRAAERAQARTFEPIEAPIEGVVAVGWGPGGPVAGGDRLVGRVDDEWVDLGETGNVRAVDGGLVAAEDGVYRLTEAGVDRVGLDDVRDVAGHGRPLAATADGLFALANGWQSVAEGAFDRVASDGHGHAHAVGPTGLGRRVEETGEWTPTELPGGSPAVDVAYGGGIVAAVTDDGTLCVDAGDGWRHQLLGVRGVNEIAVGAGSDAA